MRTLRIVARIALGAVALFLLAWGLAAARSGDWAGGAGLVACAALASCPARYDPAIRIAEWLGGRTRAGPTSARP